MIVIKLVGGLASQLHKYAVVRSIAEKYNKEFKVDLSAYENIEEKDVMKYGLPNIGLNPLVANKQDLANSKTLTMLGSCLYFINGALSEVPFLGRFSSKVLNKIESKNITRDILFKSFLTIHVSDSTSLEWIEKINQTENCYVKAEFGLRFDIIEDIREDLKEAVVNTNISETAQKYLDQIKKSALPVSMHVRRGDYVTNKNVNDFHGVCDENYYKEALEKYDAVKEAHIFVFSDDLEWVKQEFKSFLPKNTVFVSNNKNYEDFLLMVNCSNHIIANSGFSSMSAWLSGTDELNVTSPARWFIHEETNRNQLNILPKGWVYL